MKEKIVMTEENGGRGDGKLDVPTANCKGSFTIVNIFSIVQRVLILRPPSPLPTLVH